MVTNLPLVTLDELTTLSVTNIANDADLPPQTLAYTVTALIDTNAMIANGWPLDYATTNPSPIINSNGVITWTPSEAQGPGVYIITAVATDNGTPPLSVTNSFTVTVNEVNTPPVLPSQPDYTINRLTPLVVNNTAADSDIPPNPLTYQLSGPAGAVIDTNGVITWTPTLAQGGTTNVFTTIVTDTNAFALANRSLSATNRFTVVVTTSINLTGGQPQTNTIAAGGIVYYAVPVPANADFATNRLLFATAPVNVWFDTNAPPTTNRLLLPDVPYPTGTTGTAVLSTNTTPPLVPGSTYYLGVQNTNAVAVTFAVAVDFHLVPPLIVPPAIASIIGTNIGGTNGFLLTWYAPTNDHFMVQWTASLPSLNWQTFTNIIGYDLFISPTNSRFTFFDDGSQTSGFGPMRYYRLFRLGSGAGLTNGAPQTNTLASGGLVFYRVNVPANADEATNRLLFATGPLNVWFTTNLPPTFADPGRPAFDYECHEWFSGFGREQHAGAGARLDLLSGCAKHQRSRGGVCGGSGFPLAVGDECGPADQFHYGHQRRFSADVVCADQLPVPGEVDGQSHADRVDHLQQPHRLHRTGDAGQRPVLVLG